MILLPRKLHDSMIKAALDGMPEEICGFIGGTVDGEKKTVKEIYCIENADHSETRFSMKAEDQFGAIRDMRAKGLELIGNFHSHPKAPPYPSDEDIRLAYDKGASYVIISLSGETPVINSFRIDNGMAEREELVIEEM